MPGKREETKVSSPCVIVATVNSLSAIDTVKSLDVNNLIEPLKKLEVANAYRIEAFSENNKKVVNGYAHVYEAQQNVKFAQNRASQSSSYSSTSLSSIFTPQEIIIHEPVRQSELEIKEAEQTPQNTCFLSVNVNNLSSNNSTVTKISIINSNNNCNYDSVDKNIRKENKQIVSQEDTCSKYFRDMEPSEHDNITVSDKMEKLESNTSIREYTESTFTLPSVSSSNDDIVNNDYIEKMNGKQLQLQEKKTTCLEPQCEMPPSASLLHYEENTFKMCEQSNKMSLSPTCFGVKSPNTNSDFKWICTGVLSDKSKLEEEKNNEDNEDSDDDDNDFVLQATTEMRTKVKLLKEPRKPGHSIGNWANVVPLRCNSLRIQNGAKMTHELMPVITQAEVKKHNTREDMWMVIDDVVYDITQFASYHPGGSRMLEHCAGKDATALYYSFHPWVSCEAVLGKFVVGKL